MKLLYCIYCQDAVRLQKELRACKCGRSRGRYFNEVFAEVSPRECAVVCLHNTSVLMAVQDLPHSREKGPEIKAWLASYDSDHITWRDCIEERVDHKA